jgi:serine/threonine protein phosphatase 1
MIIYAIGDIHGCSHLLTRLLADVSAHAAKHPGRKRLVYLGDYVDRGPASAAVIDMVMSGPPAGIDEQVCLRGNHEQLMWVANRRVDWAFNWLLNGGVATKRSYSGDGARLTRHLDWIETLPLMHREGCYLFVHAGIVPGDRTT